jgi:hypothetical protein
MPMANLPEKISFEPQPLKVGVEWCVVAIYPKGQQERIAGFKTEREAVDWIGSSAALNWVKARGYP